MENRKKIMYTTRTMTADQFFNAYYELAKDEEKHILLESGRDGNYSIAGVNPLVTCQLYKEDRYVEVIWRDGKREVLEGDPLEQLFQFTHRFQVKSAEDLPIFQGGLIGFISYDYVRRFEQLPNKTKEVVETPDLYFYLFDEWAVFDTIKETAYFLAFQHEQVHIESIAEKWQSASKMPRVEVKNENIDFNMSQQLDVSVTSGQFEEMVRAVQSYIEQGDVTQVNLSVRQSKRTSISSLELYHALRQVNPSPYMASISAENFAVASCSPELLLKKRGSLIETRPIGGTRKRGQTEEEDAYNAQDLLNDAKEKAEHIILVDLEKEDFSKVCQQDTVETNEFMVVEKYSHVMHLVSNVRGLVKDHISNADIIKATFPGGTITGAPKLRTMEIIEQLEPEKRGLYTGSIGWFSFDGDFELNVVIRTAIMQDEQVHIQAGAGLVKESIPKEEYVESIAKGEALWKAVALAERYASLKGE